MNQGIFMAHAPFADTFMVISVFALALILHTLKAKEAAHILAALTIAVLIADKVWIGALHIAWGIASLMAILYAVNMFINWMERLAYGNS